MRGYPMRILGTLGLLRARHKRHAAAPPTSVMNSRRPMKPVILISPAEERSGALLYLGRPCRTGPSRSVPSKRSQRSR